MEPPSSFAKAPPAPVEVRALEKIIASLSQDVDDVYERLDILEKYTVWLKDLEKKNPQNAYIQALLGLNYSHLAEIRTELGVNAIDYWAYISEVVDPLKYTAKQHLDTALSAPDLEQSVRAWSHYYRGTLTEEYDADATESDYTRACELGYTKACKTPKESE